MRKHVALVMTLATMLASSAFGNQTPEFGWALVSNGSTIATSLDEWNRLDEWIDEDERALFARFDEAGYLIRDPSTLDRIDQLVEPIRKLGEKAREVAADRVADRGDKAGRREWKERLRPFKEKRREMMHRVSGKIEALARAAVRQGRALRLN